MATIKDVANMAQVSVSTVSRALNGTVFVEEETRQKIMEAVKVLNYQPNTLAKGLKKGKTNTISLIIPSIRNPSLNIIARGVGDEAAKKGFTMILCNTDESYKIEKKYIDQLRSNWVDGIIFCTALKSRNHLDELKKSGYPIVLVSRRYDDSFDTFCVDNRKAGYMATEQLIKKGYRRIGIAVGRTDLDLYANRLKGYKEALKEYGLPYDESLVIHARDGERAMIHMTPAIEEIMKMPDRPDAIFATGDLIALNIIRAVKDLGLTIPGDLGVIGFDDIDISMLMDPPLTTVAQPLYKMGVMAADRLIQRITSKENMEPVINIFQPEIIMRKSI